MTYLTPELIILLLAIIYAIYLAVIYAFGGSLAQQGSDRNGINGFVVALDVMW